VDDWLAHFDPKVEAAEHIRLFQHNRETEARNAAGGPGRGGDVRDRDRTDAESRMSQREAMAKGRTQECDHARGYCENGDPDACGYLTEACGLSEDEVADLLDEPEEDPDGLPEEEITGQAAGALKRAWGGYQGAVDGAADALAALIKEWRHAQAAADAINSVRADHGQAPIHFEELEELQADLEEFATETMRADCEECHAHHEHDHGETVDAEGEGEGSEEIEPPNPAAPAAKDSLPSSEVLRGETLEGTGLAPEDFELAAEHQRSAGVRQANKQLRAEQGELSTHDVFGNADNQRPPEEFVDARPRQGDLTEHGVDPDTRQAQGRETRTEAERNQGGLRADTREDPNRGAETPDQTSEQQQFRDPDQGTL
jgi:hypothetical protein